MNTNNHIKRQPHSDGAPDGQTHGGGHGFRHAASSRQRLMPYAHLLRPCHLYHYLSLQEPHGGCCRHRRLQHQQRQCEPRISAHAFSLNGELDFDFEK